METITRFKADDGAVFDTAEKCIEHENLTKFIQGIMLDLGKRNNSSAGWVQHDPATVIRCRVAIIELCREMGMGKAYPVFNHEPASEIHPMSAVGRILDDTGGPTNAAWRRFSSIDEQGREHNQPYFAINGPDEDHACVEDRR